MRRVAAEEVMRIQRERHAINELNFRDIIWTYQGQPIDIPVQTLDEFEICGLNNVDFVTSNYLPDRPWQEEAPTNRES